MTIHRDEPASGIVRLTIDLPPVNALDPAAIAALTDAFRSLTDAPPATGVLLTGAGRAFSAGVDVQAFAALDQAGRLAMARAITAMTAAAVALPCPMVAMVNGHALGGGLIIALCADWRVAVDDARIKLGLLEAQAGVPFPAGPMAILRHLLSGALTRRLALFSETFDPAAMHRFGLIDALCDADALLDRGIERLQQAAAQPGFTIVKRQTMAALAEELAALAAAGEEPYWA